MAVNTKDKYYTPEWLVKHTVKKAVEIIGKENITDIIEPSAGDGAFIDATEKYFYCVQPLPLSGSPPILEETSVHRTECGVEI